jgi:hypothetical protein
MAYAGEGVAMKCEAKACGYETRVTFGGGMFFQQLTGYCRACKKFVYLGWTRENIPDEMKARIKPKPKPKPLGEVWDPQTGKVLTIHACPHCKGPFREIKKASDLKHCPKCNKPEFAVDKTKPMIAID